MLYPGSGALVTALVAGSQKCGFNPSPYDDQYITFPVGSRITCVGTQPGFVFGQVCTADHCPVTDVCPKANADVSITAKIRRKRAKRWQVTRLLRSGCWALDWAGLKSGMRRYRPVFPRVVAFRP